MSSLELLNIVRQWKWHLIVVAIIALFASVIFSGPAFITPKYKSYAVVYPSNLVAYSTESPTEQMLQLFRASDIRDQVINQFHLSDRYKIDTTGDQWRTELIRTYEDNVGINKTEYESVEIDVMDKDPKVAADIADSILRYLDIKARTLHRAKAEEIVVITHDQVARKKTELDSMEALEQDMRTKYGMLDYVTQSKEITRGYLKGLTDGRSGASMNEVKNMINNLQNKGGDFYALEQDLIRVRSTYNDLELSYENALKDVNKVLTYSNMVTRPVPADRKSYPIRWLIVVFAVAGATFFSFIIILLFASPQRLRMKN